MTIRTRVMARLASARPRSLRAILGILVFVVLMGLISHGHYAASGDAVHYMIAAHSAAFDRDLDLGNNYSDDSRILKASADGHARMGRDGIMRPAHDIGMPLLASPLFGAAYKLAQWSDSLPESLRRRAKIDQFIALRQLVSMLMILATAALAKIFFDITTELTGDRAHALLWSAIWALSPPILTHGYVFLTEIPTALVALWVYWRLQRPPWNENPRLALLVGLATGFLVLLHVRNIGLALALAVVALWRLRRVPACRTGFLLGVAIVAAFKIAVNLQFWGTLVTTPHARVGAWAGFAPFASELVLRVTGLLFDARHGLLPSAPLYLLVPGAWLVMRRRSRTVAAEVLFIVALYLLFVVTPFTNVHGWRGGWSPAARFLVPIAPFLALALPALTAERRALGVVAGAIVAAVLTAQVALDIFLWGHPMLLWSEGPGPAPWLEALIGDAAAMFPAWESVGASMLWSSMIALAIWIAISWTLAEPRGSRALDTRPELVIRSPSR